MTGLIVNTKVNVPRRFVRNIRAILHDCEKNGLAAADARFQGGLDRKQRRGGSPPLIEHLRGKLDYLRMVRDGDDPLYGKLALQAQRVSPTFKHGVPVWGRAAGESYLLEAAVWIVLGMDQSGFEVVQGTAFSLEGIGVVSARHVFDNPPSMGNPIHHWEIFRASDPHRKFRVTAIYEHASLDLTIVRSGADHLASLRPISRKITVGDAVTVVGFPQWHSIADRLFRFGGTASQTRVISGIS